MKSNLVTRLLTAVVAAPLLLSLMYLAPPWGWLLLALAASALGAFELFGMTHPADPVARTFGAALTVGVGVVLWFHGTDARALLVLLLLLPIVALFFTLARLGDIQTAALRGLAMGFGPLYVGGGLVTTAMLRRDAGPDGPSFLLLALMLSWLSDTGAYFAGRFLGKHPLFPAVSPKKTIEGAFGGLAGSIVGALLASLLYLRSLPVVHGLALAVVGGAAGQAGDLAESLLKRSTGVKDSGGIVPGHGGILDRVDALLVTSITCYLYVLFVRLTPG